MSTRHFNDNLILLTDSYKASHWVQYPEDTETVFSYLESRGGMFDELVAYGFQYFIKRYLSGKAVSMADINFAEDFCKQHGVSFNRNGWEYIVNVHGGKLPVSIKAIPEGTVVPTKNVLMTIENTDPKCFWLTNYLETLLLQVWYPITVATLSREMKKHILNSLRKSADTTDSIGFKLHDFGFRGASSVETAAIGASAHLVNFMGTDTMPGILLAMEYYKSGMAGFSIPASEHSTITSWQEANELKAMENMLDKYPTGIVACVSDSFNIYRAVGEYFGTELRDKVMNREGTLVMRPDCYAEGTEILSENGFLDFRDLENNPELKVAQYAKDGTIEFVKPKRFIKQYYQGEMINFYDKKGRLDITVTPNHNMVRMTQKGVSFREANNFPKKLENNHRFIRSGIIKSQFDNIGLTYLERIAIAFQADGSYESGANVSNMREKNLPTKMRFNFTKKRKADRLIEHCINANVKYSVHHEPSRPDNYNIYVYFPYFMEKDFGWVKIDSVGYNWCCDFIEEISHWDATRRTQDRIKYDTTKKINAIVVQTIATLAGYGCHFGIFKDERKEHFSDVYSLTILKHNNFIGGQAIKNQKINYDGYVYCVTVDSGMIVVRNNNKTLVSGNSGDPSVLGPELLNIAWDKFGGHVNTKGYKVLDSHVRFIWGDGISYDSIVPILNAIMDAGFSTENLAFGMGGALLQMVNRDTQKFAFKCSAIRRNGEWHDVYKNPIHSSFKKSKKGRLGLFMEDGVLVTKAIEDEKMDKKNLLKEVFRDGRMVKTHKFADIRKRAEIVG